MAFVCTPLYFLDLDDSTRINRTLIYEDLNSFTGEEHLKSTFIPLDTKMVVAPLIFSLKTSLSYCLNKFYTLFKIYGLHENLVGFPLR